jgi:hypothetical protein
MATIEAFRICLLSQNHALPAEELSRRQTIYEGALRRLLAPLNLEHRLTFMSANTSDGLWQVATITSSGQMGIPEGAPIIEYLDQELHREATTAGNLVFETFNKLAQLINQHDFTPASFENFCTEHFGKLEAEQIKPLLRAAIRARDTMQVITSSGDFSLFNLGATPQLLTEDEPMLVRFRVVNISLTCATVKPHRISARQLGIRVRGVHLAFELGLTVDSAIGRKLFKALQQESCISCTVRRVSKMSGDFHGLLLPMSATDKSL